MMIHQDSFLGLLGLIHSFNLQEMADCFGAHRCDWISLVTTPHRGPISTHILELFRNEMNSRPMTTNAHFAKATPSDSDIQRK